MRKRLTSAGFTLLAGLVAGSGGTAAQSCFERASEGSGPTRQAAMRAAYESVLRGIDPSMAQAWSARNMRIGEAPGYAVTKLSTKCSAGGQGQTCRVEASLCKE